MKNGTNGKGKKIAYIDGVAHQIEPHHSTILKFVREKAGIKEIPTLCDDPNLAPYGACRVCSVDVALKKDGPVKTMASCHAPVTEGSYIITNNKKKRKRKNIKKIIKFIPETKIKLSQARKVNKV